MFNSNVYFIGHCQKPWGEWVWLLLVKTCNMIMTGCKFI
uniref:Uncharacterized protein n=1 Tax=Rhizophora mucronata TaxID=61149 RepID=A0A2P2QJP6_RHIMU